MTSDTLCFRYVGDLSRADARKLAELAVTHPRILEFGVGASTQIFAQAAMKSGAGVPGAREQSAGAIIGLDRSEYWIGRTRALLDALAPGHGVRLVHFQRLSVLDTYGEHTFDLIFDDGDDDLRLEFALASWRLLAPGGVFVFHDTRRPRDAGNALAVVTRFHREIGRVDLNAADTNLTIIHKVPPRPKPPSRKTGGDRS